MLLGGGALYALARLGSFTAIPSRVSDTPGYERTAQAALLSRRFFAGERPFTVPLLYRIVPGDHGRIVAQLVLSICSWLVLALVTARCLDRRLLSASAATLILLFSLTTPVILWDTLLLSESVTISLFALAVALALLLVRDPSWPRVGGFLAVVGLWVFARDSNAYVAACLGVVAAALLLRRGFRLQKGAAALGCLVLAGASLASASAGGRWWAPMWDVWTQRIEPAPAKLAYFKARAHGRNWFNAQARDIYASYLVSHPGYLLAQPFHGHQHLSVSSTGNADSVLAPDLSAYNDNAVHRVAPLPGWVQRLVGLEGLATVLLALAIVVPAALHVLGRRRAIWVVPLTLIAVTYPSALVAWHLSGQEVDRHALGGALGLRLGILLLGLFVLDALFQDRESSSVAGGERSLAP